MRESETTIESEPTSTYSLSVIVPTYNEEEVLPEFHRRLIAVLSSLPAICEVVYVNDGSSDNTLTIMQNLRAEDHRVSIVDLSRIATLARKLP